MRAKSCRENRKDGVVHGVIGTGTEGREKGTGGSHQINLPSGWQADGDTVQMFLLTACATTTVLFLCIFSTS